VLVVAGIAFALRPGPGPQATAGNGPAAAAPATQTAPAPASPAVTTSHAVEATAHVSAPAQPTKPAGAVTATSALAAMKPLKPAPGVKTIVVDKSEQRVTLYTAKGTPIDTFRCASGILYPRVGTYHVYGHTRQSYSLYDNTTFFYFTQFVKSDKNNNIGFHSIPQNPDGTLVGGLGKPVSHGCVRLSKDKAKFVYTWAATGTRVVVKN
jgi:lipoprotein-anchoring transpeptidase ErfK/SrfK